ncbi:hypothetical protein LSH36_24g05011 [Paralvinella palmiformis]|uniref:Calpain-5 n=1 Tax=Paralvinella palmiformis TaxID=53620 RepID=A0AAD9KB00_9ANNE|nr:hypothetical protein LSH36_24g05011 [Paralvinella palmiformis]
MGIFSHPTPYNSQVYSELRKQAQQSGELFVDKEFPAEEKSLFKSGGKLAGIEWKRPKDICSDPHLFVEGASSNDLIQGELGNCWFVAACSCLAMKKSIWQKVIPDHKDQEWDEKHPEKYSGIFHFEFWRFGEWVDVVIDDFLPTRNGKLVYVHSKQENEFWSALLEKAYAKVFGSYEVLDGGELAEALEDFTSGVSEPINLVEGNYATNEKDRDDLFKTTKEAAENEALMAAAIPGVNYIILEALSQRTPANLNYQPNLQMRWNRSTDVGLVIGHAYGITAVKRVALEGSWSEEWNKIDKSSREKIGLTFDEDGEFWMTFEDFCKHFTSLAICRVVNTSFFSLQKKWHSAEMHGEWRAPHMSGGCINNKETFHNNPQFLFDVTDKDGDEVLFSLTQKAGRGGEEKETVGFTVIKVEENRRYRLHKVPTHQVEKSSSFINSRGVFLRHTLQRGRYVVIVCMFKPGGNGTFLFRLYTSDSNHARELTEDKPTPSFWSSLCCCALIPSCRYAQHITQLTVLSAAGLEKQDRVGGADPYVIINCEGEKIQSPSVQDSLNPSWNISAVFYRSQAMSKPIKIDIWNSNPIRDDFMGRCLLPATEEAENKVVDVTLIDRKDKAKTHPGKLKVKYTTSRNLQFL